MEKINYAGNKEGVQLTGMEDKGARRIKKRVEDIKLSKKIMKKYYMRLMESKEERRKEKKNKERMKKKGNGMWKV